MPEGIFSNRSHRKRNTEIYAASVLLKAANADRWHSRCFRSRWLLHIILRIGGRLRGLCWITDWLRILNPVRLLIRAILHGLIGLL